MVLIINVISDFLPTIDKNFRRLLLYSRIGVMAMLSYYGKDGLSYQDIKDSLKLEDGSLSPNLLWLRKNDYITSEDTEIGEKSIAVYYITSKGEEAYKHVKTWLRELLVFNNEKGEL